MKKQITIRSIPHYMMPTKCAAAKAVKAARPTRRVRAAGTRKAVRRRGQDDGGDAPLRGDAVSLLGIGVKRRSDSRSGPERPTRIPVAATDPAAHFMRETRSSRAMHE